MNITKKRKNGERDSTDFMRKKSKVKKSKEPINNPQYDEDEDRPHAELLSGQTIREGMLLLGCVIEINRTYLVMSLPGYLSGRVPLNKISNEFTKILESSCDTTSSESSVHAFIKVGMVFPCKVLQISRDAAKRRPVINLSINPKDVNAELKPISLYPKMVLYVTVCSVEDHGYVVDVGAKNIQAFMTRQGSEDEILKIGEVRPAYIKKINFSKGDPYAKIQLSKLDFSDDFPTISDADITLPAILPGAKIVADVVELDHPFIYMKYGIFDACASVLSLGSTYRNIAIGSEIAGTVLYIHPITHIIYLMLNLKPSPELFAGYFGLNKYEVVKSLKYEHVYKNHIYYKINKGTYGFIHKSDLPREWDPSFISRGSGQKYEAYVYQLHFMDNLVQMSAKPLLRPFVSLEDIRIGDIYEASIEKHIENGMFVKICHGVYGFIRKIHMSDVFVTKPEVLHPVGKRIQCRVLTKDNKGKLIMTCKESLLHLAEDEILSSYERIEKGQFYKGVIGKISKDFILILFFNQVKGIVLPSCIPKGSMYFEGQTVLVRVQRFNPIKIELILSLKIEEAPEMNSSSGKSHSEVNLKKATVLSNKSKEIINKCEYVSDEPVEARILKVKGSQLIVSLNSDQSDIGRVHITNAGCVIENVHPLREFSVGQVIQVFVIGETRKKRRNFLSVTHKNFTYVKECSLNPLTNSLSKDLNPGSSVIGFVKKVYDVYAVLWLTPSKTGILDYLHFSENLQEVKKLHRQLKVGMSLRVSVFENQISPENNKGNQNIILTKIDVTLPEAGRNVIGLMQVASLEKGLSLKLPFNYHGFASVTDLTDIYKPVQNLFDKFQNLRYLLCHVLEVNHVMKTCQLSLRKSMVYLRNEMKEFSGDEYCPELTHENVTEGMVAKGFVKSVSDTAITVILGKNLEGQMKIHKCATSGCKECEETKRITDKYTVGGVAKIIVLKNAVGKKPCIVAFEDHRSLGENIDHERIDIDEEISWDEIE